MGFAKKGYAMPSSNYNSRRYLGGQCKQFSTSCAVKTFVPKTVIVTDNGSNIVYKQDFQVPAGFTGYWHGTASIYEQ